MSDRAVVAVDAAGQVIDRLARAWLAYRPDLFSDVVDTARHHPYRIRRAGAPIVWATPLPFVAHPRAATAPQIVVVHHMAEPEIAPFLKALPHADAIATGAIGWQVRLRELTGRNVWLFPQAIDSARFRPLADRDEARRRFGIAEGSFVAGFSARALANAYGRKGIDLLRETLRQARARWPELVLLLVGSGWDAFAAELRAENIVVIRHEPAAADDTAAIYPLMDVFLCTSVEEGGPTTILEAMACEVPVISTRVGHVPDVLEDGVTGWIVGTRDAGEFVARMRALRDDPAAATAMGRAARAFIREHRDESAVVPRIDFDGIFAEARARFAQRGARDRLARRVNLGYLGLRYLARRVTY